MRLSAIICGSIRSRWHSPARRALLLCLAACAGACTAPARSDDSASVLFVSSHTSTPYQQFIDQARQSFRAGATPTIASRAVAADQLTGRYDRKSGNAPDMVVALGTRAAEALQHWRPEVPVVYALLSRLAYDELRQSRRLVCPARRCTAVFIDQPMPRVFEVLAAAFPGRQRLGVLFGPTSIEQEQTLARLAANRGFSLRTAVMGTDEDLLPALNRLLRDSDVLLAVPDPVVYNPRTAQSILLTTYRYKVPVMAYSSAYAGAGAALSVYSTPQQIARQTAGIVRGYFSDSARVLPPPQYPRHFTIQINRHVAESLDLEFDNNAELQLIIKEADDD
jgi:ABC-type uncharacterized transport system substrate-binding protein